LNTIPITRNTTPAHWLAIVSLARQLVDEGCVVVVEATFKTGARADIYLPELRLVMEVLHSEPLERLRRKYAEFYDTQTPVGFGWITTTELAAIGPKMAVARMLEQVRDKVRP
jgi:hypothetical protein